VPRLARSGGVNDHPWVCAPAHRWSLTPLREMAVAVEAPDAAKKRLLGPNVRNIAATCAHVARVHGYLCPCCEGARLLVPMLRESTVTCAHVARKRGYLCPCRASTVTCAQIAMGRWMLGRLRTSVAPGATTRTEFRKRGKNAHRVSRPGQERARGSLPGARTRTELRARGKNAHGVLYPGPERAQSCATGGHNAHGIRYPGQVRAFGGD